jgi:hypothetical protein
MGRWVGRRMAGGKRGGMAATRTYRDGLNDGATLVVAGVVHEGGEGGWGCLGGGRRRER